LYGLGYKNITSLIVDNNLVAINFAVVGVLVGGHEVLLAVKLHKTVPARFTLLVADDTDRLDNTVLLGGESDTSNSYFRVFSVVL
jgi:hypothetical protein